MAEQSKEFSVQAIMHEMNFTGQEIERRKQYVGLQTDDLRRLKALRDFVAQRVGDYVSVFFDYLLKFPEAKTLRVNRELLDAARRLKEAHILAMVGEEYGANYVEQRVELALIYSKARIDSRVFLGAFHHLLAFIGRTIVQQFGQPSDETFECFMSLKKVAFFDIGIIIDVLVIERERVIRQQQEAIRELSTPSLQIRDRLLLLPIIGVIDTLRARQLTENLLRNIRLKRAKVVVMDITGVATIDSKVANHLLQTVTAARLMGAEVIVTGLSPDVAQSLVALGIDLAKLYTAGDLQGGMEEAEHLLGYSTCTTSEPPFARNASNEDTRL